MKKIKQALAHLFIDGLSGMALGLFSTVIIGTIIVQMGTLVGGTYGQYIVLMGKVASAMTGAGIAAGVACKYKAAPLVTAGAMVAGMIGAYATSMINGTIFAENVLSLKGAGEPLGAFIAAYVAITVASLVSGKTTIDILLTPAVAIGSGGVVGLLVGPPISAFMLRIGDLINWSAEQQPVIMGALVAVLMGMVLTGPISSAALAIVLNLTGLAAGAATVGCAVSMVGFAVASYGDNGIGGLLAQGFGTSKLQMPNIVKKPVIWIPTILTSAILGPVATSSWVNMTNNAMGAGMGTSGLVGQINTYAVMTAAGMAPAQVLLRMLLLHFILPGCIAGAIAAFMRKHKWIQKGDMKLPS